MAEPKNLKTVQLYLYKMSSSNSSKNGTKAKSLLPFWHTSVVVFGKEYTFNNTDGQVWRSIDGTERPDEIHNVGTTNLDEDQLEAFLELMEPQYNEGTYELLKRNCNTFTSKVLAILKPYAIPDHLAKQMGLTVVGNCVVRGVKKVCCSRIVSSYNFFGKNPPEKIKKTAEESMESILHDSFHEFK
jgi:hypothetical protein